MSFRSTTLRRIAGSLLLCSLPLPLAAATRDAVTFSESANAIVSAQTRLEGVGSEAGSLFGRAIAVSGNTAVVGAVSDDTPAGTDAGSAYVFVRSGSTWNFQAQLFASDAAAGDSFGLSVAIDGDTIVVGAPNDDTPPGGINSATTTGSVYVFVRHGLTWTEQAHLIANNPVKSTTLGASVSVSGDTVIAGAIGYGTYLRTIPETPVQLGAAYVFVRNGAAWTQQAVLLASDGAANDFLGISASLHGDTAVVGAYGHDANGLANAGAAYVFVRNGATWTEQAKLVAADGVAGDGFGVSVSIDGDTIAVGAWGRDPAGILTAGSGFVFVRSGANWSQQAELVAPDAAASDQAGTSTEVRGSSVVVGGPRDDTAAGIDAGSANVYARSGSTWSHLTQLVGTDAAAGDLAGYAVGMHGGTIILGAISRDTAAGVDAGSAYVFQRAEATVFRPSTATWHSSEGTSVSWGAANDVPVPADYDGDGVADYATYRPSTGGWLIQGSSTGATITSVLGGALDTPAPADYDGDGKADVAVFRKSTGVWTIFQSAAGGATRTVQWGGSGGDIPVPADYDGDGKADIAIFSQGNGGGGGLWYIVLSGNGGTRVVQWGGTGGDIPIPYDFDGDGRDDIAIESPVDGRWYIIRSSNGGTRVEQWGGSGGDQPQPSDFDGDGKADLCIFNPGAGQWYIVTSSNGATVVLNLGQQGDIAVGR